MEIINNPTHDEIKKAAKALKDGHLVAFPTETVYGLGADATNEKAVSRIYTVKDRPTNHPLIVHISSINQLDKWAVDIPEYAIKLAKEFWPGPMTLILKRNDLARDFITGGQDSVGLRVPDQSVALELLNEFEKLDGFGIAAPSANRFGAVSPTTAEAVKDEIGNFLKIEDLIIDGRQSLIGIESSIIDCTNGYPIVLRPGAITSEMIKKTTGYLAQSGEGVRTTKAPGLLNSHYSPKAKIILNSIAELGQGFLALSNIPTPPGAIRLAMPDTLEEFARVLYASLRFADQINLEKITVIVPPGTGLAIAIKDRLIRAARLGSTSE
jgi:L-threonylcarbamoyladenylate synthase